MVNSHKDDSHDKRTVWYISKYLSSPDASGAGTRGYNLMRELVVRGNQVVVFASDSNHLTETPTLRSPYLVQEVDGVKICWVRTVKYRSAASMRRILSWVHFEFRILRFPAHTVPRPDVVVASSLSLLSIITGAWFSRRFGARLVFEVRDIWPLTLTEEGGFSSKNIMVRLLGAVERFGYRRADAIVGTMPNLADHVHSVSASRKPVYCIPMGYEPSADHAGAQIPQVYLEAGIPDGRFLVGYAGTVGRTNALITLFECAEHMANDPAIHFVVVGEGDLLQEYRARYGALPNITFVGRVPRQSVQVVLSRFDVLYLSTFPSTVWKYGQSLNKLIDYMLSAKPVVASFSGFPSMINEAGSGSFVPAGDSAALATEIWRLAALECQVLKEMGERGREWLLANRSYPILAEQYEQVLFPDAKSPREV